MSTVETVRGSVDARQLGVTLMHEHIFVLSPEIIQNYPEVWGEEDQRVQDAVVRMNELYSRGVQTVVDLTVVGLGRYVPRIECVARQTKINIIVATGLYTYCDLPFYFHFRGPGTPFNGPEVMVDMFVRDIREGIAGTSAKAGILKCCTDQPGLTKDVERMLRAVAQAHRAHWRSDLHAHARAHQARARSAAHFSGRRRGSVARGDRALRRHDDIDYLEELIGNGSYLGMDRFGIDTILPFEARVQTVARMCERGHAGKMVLSHDAACLTTGCRSPSCRRCFRAGTICTSTTT